MENVKIDIFLFDLVVNEYILFVVIENIYNNFEFEFLWNLLNLVVFLVV